MPIVVGNLKRLELFRNDLGFKERLWTITNALQSGLREKGFNIGVTNSCVTPVFFEGGTFEAANIIVDMRENHDIFCSMVVYPVVPKGVIMLRLIPTAAHTLEDVQYTLDVFDLVKKRLANGEYNKEKIDFSLAAK